MKVLVVEDDRVVGETLKLLLSGFKYAVDVAEDGQTAWEMTQLFDYDLLVLDVGLPVLDGLSLCQKLRNEGFQQPILLLTGQGGAHQKAIALNAGADDYVVKPFDSEELVARVQALLRRGGGITAPVLAYSHLALNPNSQQVTYGTRLLHLTPKEYAILELFLREPQKVLNAATIVDRAWNSIDCPGEESVRVHIKDLRHKLAQAGAPKDLIQTVYQRGYRLNPMYATDSTPGPEKPLTALQIAELKSVNEQLRAALEELRATQAELQLANQTIESERQQLQKARDEMEYRVIERTAELVALNGKLQDRQQQLQSLGEHLQLVMDVVGAGTAEVDLQTNEQVWSDRMYELLGYFPGEVKPTYQSWRDRVHPDDIERIEREFSAKLDFARDWSFEYRVIYPDRSVRWLLSRKHELKDESGRICRRLWVALEIGDRKQLETTLRAYEEQKLALQESEQKFQHFAEHSNFVIWINDVKSRKNLYVNPAYEQVWGKERQIVTQEATSWEQSVHPEDRPIVESKIAREQRAQSTDVEYRIVRPDGSERWIRDRGFPILNGDDWGGTIGGVAEDITERKNAEIALQQQLERTRMIAELTRSIRQSLDLDKILQVTVERVRDVLQSDRVIIFQFEPDWEGKVVAESAIPNLEPMLCVTIKDPCFPEKYINDYSRSQVRIVDDLERSNLEQCYFELLQHFHVKANLVVPILQTDSHCEGRSNCELPDRVWGLLIAHHCIAPHHWELEEVTLLQAVADQLGVALEQSDLYERTRKELLERKRAELELRNSENRYRLLFDSNPNPIWVLDADSLHFLAVNQAAVECYGYSKAEFLKMTLTGAGILSPEDIEPVIDLYASFSSQERNYLGIWRHTKRDGSQIDVEILAHSFFFEQVPAYLVLVADITERLRAERQIRQQAALLDIASDAILVRDLEHRILYWNQGAQRLYGWEATEAIGQKATDLLQDEKDRLDEVMRELLDSGEWRGELSKTTKDGQKVTVEARWTLVKDESDRAKWILSVNTDISEKKLLEAQFYRAQRLESLGTLASGIAHDLNNVLTPILAISQMMLSKKHKLIEERSQEMLQLVQDSAKRGAHMVSQILTFARGMEGKRIPVQVSSLLKELIKVVESTFPKSLDIRLEILDRPLGLVLADPTHLHQILLNLCVNSRDAMPDGGILTCSAENYRVDELFTQMHLDARPGNYVAIAVTDTGTGIAPEVQERMFEPFFTTKAMGQGTGLGLSVVLGMVKNYGGFVQVSSELGQGTQIKVYLPAVETQQVEEQSSVELPQGRGELILVVDDDRAVGQTNQSLLESYQYRTLAARDGVEAIALYQQHQNEIQAVLIDMMMPNMDGIHAILALKEIDLEAKIIAMSGLSSYRQSALEAGAKVFLAKPYTLEDLLGSLSCIIAS